MTQAMQPPQNVTHQASVAEHGAHEASRDVAVDAIVYEVHPACDVAIADGQLTSRPTSLLGIKTEPARYRVPQRFGMSAILGIMTALAVLFGIFHLSNAEPIVYLFFGLQTLVICVAQMFSGKAPRVASVIAGLILGPFFMPYVFASELPPWGPKRGLVIVLLTVFGVPAGALLGYLTGACAAGIPYVCWLTKSRSSAR